MVAKGEEAKVKKKNKAIRKKLNRDPATAVSARVAAIIAAKKRRHTGKRRQCQGMCFSLPTLEDPFNDRRFKENNNNKPSKTKNPNPNPKQPHQLDTGSPSKFLFNCLNSIREFSDNKNSFIANKWGFEFWKSYILGKDVLVGSGSGSGVGPSVEEIAWIASTAADSIQRTETDADSLNTPFLLYLVDSKENAVRVRGVCKPLKVVGIHTVCLHDASSLEHQVNGLKSCNPEFVIATPERLWELITLKEIDVSSVALLVVDAVDSLSNCLDVVKRIKNSVSGISRTVLFQGSTSDLSIQAKQWQSILKKPVDTLSLDATTTDKQQLHQ